MDNFDPAKFGLLSDREMIVLQLTSSGLSLKKIAKNLGVKVCTVETYKYRIRSKLKLWTDVQIGIEAYKAGLLG